MVVPVLFCLLCALILGVFGGVFKRIPNKQKTIGTIKKLEQRIKTPNDRVTYTAVVSYTVDGKEYYIRTPYQSSFFRIGGKLTVYYDRFNPENSKVRVGFVVYLLMWAFVFLAILLASGVLKSAV